VSVRFGISTSPQGTSYQALRDVWQAADETGVFVSGWVNDHYAAFVGPPWVPDLERGSADGWTVLAALLHETDRIRGGVLVSGVHFRSAAKLAHIAASLDWSTGGRVDVGLGAGWSPEECDTFGVALGDVATRLDRFTESVEAVVRLLAGETVTMAGDHVRLDGARLTMRGPNMAPICIGGMGERRTLPLVARYADHWSYEGADMDEFAHKLGVLQEQCAAIGRDPNDIEASAKVRFAAGEAPDVVAERAQVLIDAGVTLVLVSFPRPLDASVVEPIATTLSSLAAGPAAPNGDS
jgi:alkanesulfonate monooxygenase SsuD/methylene tetrahydromethanopterin reductase-like flavin-dependent oxidoreductase (luciferase family)